MKKHSHREFMDLWPDRKSFSCDAGASLSAVHVMYHRDSIPPHYWWNLAQSKIANDRYGLPLNILAFAAHTKALEKENETSTKLQ